MSTQSQEQITTRKALEAEPERVLAATRVLAVVIVPVLVAAFIVLYLFPDEAGRLFAWPIKPHMSAMMLGATYLGGAYFFTRTALSRQWHRVRLGLIPVTTFAAIMGIATILHWDKFIHQNFAFMLWAFLYFTLPFVIPAVWYLNQRAAGGGSVGAERLLPGWLRVATGGVGAVMLGASAILLIVPQVMIPIWPWTLSALTGRVMAAMFALPGLVGLGAAMDGRWSSASIIYQAQAVAIAFFVAAIVLNRDEIQWSQAGSWIFLASLALVAALIGLAAWEGKRAGEAGQASRR